MGQLLESVHPSTVPDAFAIGTRPVHALGGFADAGRHSAMVPAAFRLKNVNASADGTVLRGAPSGQAVPAMQPTSGVEMPPSMLLIIKMGAVAGHEKLAAALQESRAAVASRIQRGYVAGHCASTALQPAKAPAALISFTG